MDLISIIGEITKNKEQIINEESSLTGDGALLDSLGLVELCVRLETIASEEGFHFDWTSKEAMIRNEGMFQSVSTLRAEYEYQKNKMI